MRYVSAPSSIPFARTRTTVLVSLVLAAAPSNTSAAQCCR